MRRRNFIKTGLIFVPSAVFSQTGLRNPSIVGSLSRSSALAGTSFVTGQTLGTPRSDTQELGMEITIGGSNVTVTQLGLWVVSGNAGTHNVRIYSGSAPGAHTLLETVSINTSGQPVGWLYTTLGSPRVLSASTKYQIWRTTDGTDSYYDSDTTLTVTAVATVDSASYRAGANISASGGAGNCFGPVNFKYSSP